MTGRCDFGESIQTATSYTEVALYL